jgi:hypothetical protein
MAWGAADEVFCHTPNQQLLGPRTSVCGKDDQIRFKSTGKVNNAPIHVLVAFDEKRAGDSWRVIMDKILKHVPGTYFSLLRVQ